MKVQQVEDLFEEIWPGESIIWDGDNGLLVSPEGIQIEIQVVSYNGDVELRVENGPWADSLEEALDFIDKEEIYQNGDPDMIKFIDHVTQGLRKDYEDDVKYLDYQDYLDSQYEKIDYDREAERYFDKNPYDY